MHRPSVAALPKSLLPAGLLACAALAVTACDEAEAPVEVGEVVEDLSAPTVDDQAAGAVQPVMAFADLEPLEAGPEGLSGKLTFVAKEGGGVTVSGAIMGLPEPGFHGLHVHENGDCSAPDGSSAGGHFAPEGNAHGAPGADSHVGDLGNVTVVAGGQAEISVLASEATLAGDHGLVGRSVVLHAKHDDFASQPSGDSGARIACGVIRQGAG